MEDYVAHYRILERIGEGGMGVVLSAEDTKLGRRVAIKLLPARFSARSDLRFRLLREARTAAALNHPNICTVHEVGELDSDTVLLAGPHRMEFPAATPYIAMELLNGETLHALLVRTGPLPMKALLDIAVQVVDALADAHAHRIVHRDLKPQNVILTSDGRVKILDFGLAKSLQDPESDDAITRETTHSAGMTWPGHIVGTVDYLSPEQACGQPVDSRSDVFAFGTMLYELATTQRPFRGETAATTLAKILEAEPSPLGENRKGSPADLERIVRRCLQKKPADRYNNTHDLLLDLRSLQQRLTSGIDSTTPVKASNRRRWVASGVVACAAAALVVGGIIAGRLKIDNRSELAASYQQVTFVGDAVNPAVSPDGQFLAYATGTREDQKVVVHDLTGDRTLEVFRGRHITDVRWSPDGATLAVPSDYGGRLNIVSRLGGPPRVLVGRGNRVSWSPGSSEIATIDVSRKQLFFVNTASGAISRSVALDVPVAFLVDVDWSPDGDWLLVEAFDEAKRFSVWLVKPDGAELHRVLDDAGALVARWAPTSRVIYYFKGASMQDLWKLSLSSVGQPSGPAAQVLSGLEAISQDPDSTVAGSGFAISRDGRRLAYPSRTRYSNLWLGSLGDGANQDLQTRELTTGTRQVMNPSFSPDGTQIAHAQTEGKAANIFILPTAGGMSRQLTFMNSLNMSPVWSPDGQTIAFGSNEGGSAKVWQVPAGGGTPRQLAGTSLSGFLALAWAPGQDILYQRPQNRNFFFLDASGAESPLLTDDRLGWISNPLYSPTGSEVAVYWLAGGAAGLYVMPVNESVGRERRAKRLTGANGFGGLGRTVAADPYRGKDVKLAVHARTQVSNDNGGQCWLRVDRPNGQMGFFDNMATRPIRSPTWSTIEIAGRTDVDAERIAFGCGLSGVGELWVDDVELSFKNEAGAWTSVAIRNSGFEDIDAQEQLVGWRVPPGYVLRQAREKPYRGNASAHVSALPLPAGDVPIGWSPDGRTIYAVAFNDVRHILAIPVEGGQATPLLTLPVPQGQSATEATMSPDGSHIVFTVAHDKSDIRIITDFDPQRR